MANGGTVVLPQQNRFAPLAGFFQNLNAGTLERQQNQQLAQQLGQLFPQQNFQGITNPLALQAGVQAGLQQQQQQGALGLQAARPVTQRAGTFQQIADPDTGNQINALVDPISGRIIKKFGATEEGLSPKDKVQVAITQAKEFRDTPTVKNFRTVETMERNIQSALKVALDPRTKSKAFADQALVIGFNKLLDPTSVVRESEFARTPEGIALLNRLKAGVEKLSVGGVGITNADRIALADMANKLLTESKRSFNATFDDFEQRADVLGLNKKIVFGKQKRFDISADGRIDTGSNLTPVEQSELDALIKERDVLDAAELEALRRATPTLPPGGLGGRKF